MEGTIDLMTEHGVGPSDISSVEVRVPPFADRVASFREPVNGEQAKFSICQGVAGLLVDGIPDLPYRRPFSDDTCNDPRYVDARRRVTLTIEGGLPSQRGFVNQSVTLLLNDGRTLRKAVDGKMVRGHVANPFTTGERVEMVRHTVERMGPGPTERMIDLVMDLERHTVADLADVLSFA
jgi:2-methylcitrate dehydratase PrpD